MSVARLISHVRVLSAIALALSVGGAGAAWQAGNISRVVEFAIPATIAVFLFILVSTVPTDEA